MREYHYSPVFTKVRHVVSFPTRKGNSSIRLSELYYADPSSNNVYDLRLYSENTPTKLGFILTFHVLRDLKDFLVTYFEEIDNEILAEQLGDNPCEENKRE